MKKYKKLLIISCLILSQVSAWSQEFDKVATVGFVFLELPVSARYMALGETGLTLKNLGSEALFVNPALINLTNKTYSFNVAYSEWYVQTSHQALGFTYKWENIGTIGFQVVYFDFGEIERTRNQRIGRSPNLGTYSANAYSFGISFSKNLTNQFVFGVTSKYVKESIDSYYADNVIFDIGFLYETGYNNLRIGISLQNFGLESKYIEQKFKMPQIIKMGLSSEVWGTIESPNHITLIAEASHPNDMREHLQIGIENLWLNILALRAGYKFGYKFEDFSMGLGLQFENRNILFQFGMAYMKHDYLNKTIRYTLSMGF